MYQLKKNVADFVVVDGAFAGRSYRAGGVYAEVPPGEINKFEPARKPLRQTQQPAGGADASKKADKKRDKHNK